MKKKSLRRDRKRKRSIRRMIEGRKVVLIEEEGNGLIRK